MASSPPRSSLVRSCAWQWLRGTGLERFELARDADVWRLRGTIVALAGGEPAEARYEIACDGTWRTRRADVFLREAGGERHLALEVDAGTWSVNGRADDSLRGCVDVDLGWSPSTNTLPIRRLALATGRPSGPLLAAWVRFPELSVEPLAQEYARSAGRVYRYSSRQGAFVAALEVDEDGLVIDYEGVWRRVPAVE